MKFGKNCSFGSTLFIFLSLILTNSRAQESWTNLNAPSTVNITCLKKTHTGSLLLGSEGGFVYRSIDSGMHWSKRISLQNYPIRDFLITDSIIIAARTPPVSTADCFSSCPSGPNYSSDLIFSIDDGMTWVSKNEGGITALTQGKDGNIWGISHSSIMLLKPGTNIWASFPYTMDPNIIHGSSQPTHLSWGLGQLIFIQENHLFWIDSINIFSNPKVTQVLRDTVNGFLKSPIFTYYSKSSGLKMMVYFGPTPIIISPFPLEFIANDSSNIFFGLSRGKIFQSNIFHDIWNAWGTDLNEDMVQILPLGKKIIALTDKNHLFVSDEKGPWVAIGLDIQETPVKVLLNNSNGIYVQSFSGLKFKSKNIWFNGAYRELNGRKKVYPE